MSNNNRIKKIRTEACQDSDWLDVRSDFPIFGDRASSRPLAYLDSAASTQKPKCVIDRISRYYSLEHANVHRGAYRLSAEATRMYDESREAVARFLGAKSPANIVFTKGTTESINLIATALESQFNQGDVILLTLLEHHSNIVPWQLLAKRKGLKIVYADIRSNASLDIDDFVRKIADHRLKLVSFSAVCNSFGSVLPINKLADVCKKQGIVSVVDAAQAVAHKRIDVKDINCDFLAFSGHKAYGPTGIGVLYVKEDLFERMEPYQGGGGMISHVSVEGSGWAEPPFKFEAGTPPIAEAIGLQSALAHLSSLGFDRIEAHEKEVFEYAWDRLKAEKSVLLYGPRTESTNFPDVDLPIYCSQSSIIAFNIVGVHAHDFSTIADSFNVQVRAGHHCAMPALTRLNLQSTVRASLGIYSYKNDIDQLCEAISKAKEMFS